MKKLLHMVLLVALVLCSDCIAETAPSIVLSEMTTAELIALIEDANDELANRGESSSYAAPIYAGKYTVGVDISVGTYDIFSYVEDPNKAGYYTVSIFADEHDYEATMNTLDMPIVTIVGGEKYHLSLSEGNVLYMQSINVHMYLFESQLIE